MTISFQLNEAESTLWEKFATEQGLSVSELVRQSVLARIEDESDRKAYEKALQQHQMNPVTYSLEQVEREFYH